MYRNCSSRVEDCPLQSRDEKKTPRGTYDYFTDTNNTVTVVRWNDNNIVNVMVSNKVGDNPTQKATRFSRQARQHIHTDQPALINHYNNTMGGVDRMDKIIDKCRITIRSKNGGGPCLLFAWIWPFSRPGTCTGPLPHEKKTPLIFLLCDEQSSLSTCPGQ